jgi:hypothetical protein
VTHAHCSPHATPRPVSSREQPLSSMLPVASSASILLAAHGSLARRARGAARPSCADCSL